MSDLTGVGCPPALAVQLAGPNFASENEVTPHAGGPLDVPYDPARKYHICFDQNALESATVKANIATYESIAPFDGMKVTVNLDPHPLFGAPGSPNLCGLGDSYWTTTGLPWPSWATALSNVLTTKFIKFQRNFLELKIHPSVTASVGLCDWMNPGMEQGPIHNTRMAARFCKDAKLRGVWFDPEPLNGQAGWSLWKYSDRPSIYTADFSFEDYQEKVEYYGRRFMEVIEEENPGMELHLSFLYSFATAETSSTMYGLFPSFLRGLMYARRTVKVFEWGEEMYNRSGIAGESTVYPDTVGYFLSEFKSRAYLDTPINSDGTAFVDPYYRARCSTALRMDASPFNGNATTHQAGVENHHTYGGDEYVNHYQEDRRYLAGTATAAEVAAVKAARVSVGLEQAFDPTVIPGLVAYVNPEALGLSNGATISSLVDVTGNTWTGSGSPTYTAAGVGGHGGIDFVAASSQYLTCDSVASLFSGTDVPFTIVYVQDFGTLPAGTVTMLSLGRSSDADPRISVRYTAAPLLTSQRVSDSGTSDIAFGTSPTYTPTTAAAVIALVCNGATGMAMQVNGSSVGDAAAHLYDPQATIGAQTFDRMTLGALRQNGAASEFFDDPVGSFLIFNRALGERELKFVVQGLGLQYGIAVV